jgi:hypothetical protein
MIKYRPHRELLCDAMAEEREFETVEEMFDYICDDHGFVFQPGDLSISENRGKDSRIDWKETRYVCTKRYGKLVYKYPQCVGMCSLEKSG